METTTKTLKKTILSALFVLSIITITNAQDIKLVKATSQHWAGGVCCRYGTYYNFIIQSKIAAITLDTVWINGYFYPLNFHDNAINGNTKKYDSITHLTTFTIAVSENHDDAPRLNNEANHSMNETSALKNVATKRYDGVALFTYQYKGKQCSFTIKEFNVLKSLSYP